MEKEGEVSKEQVAGPLPPPPPLPPPRPPPQHKCPRCDSDNTKFCYYNNYSLSQPRYLCKACKRYWTQGGTLRNIPLGASKNKIKNKPNKRTFNTATTTSSSSHHHAAGSTASSSAAAAATSGSSMAEYTTAAASHLHHQWPSHANYSFWSTTVCTTSSISANNNNSSQSQTNIMPRTAASSSPSFITPNQWPHLKWNHPMPPP
ncbi:hypothetical protein HN51_013251 [Arachis hypogaea]|uniref:Dof zinc finger protein n=2 Tax=Arachis TaxID=3817 RepID=A0A445DR27_ARAHY|nr:dof zinc finger protein DOF1.6 [Arachis duranensis]QHO58927.1 Dof zinc finger protein PBF [Arachis hypogaea]RYR65619.1 hypothetical protein Ahy_A03g011543 [Arachis hypogaea]